MLRLITKKTFALLIIIVLLISCKKENPIAPDILISKISIANIGVFDYEDFLTYAAIYSSYEIKIITEPSNADIYYSTTNGTLKKQTGDWISIDSSNFHLQFYADKQDFKKTNIKNLDFGYKNEILIDSLKIYPNPIDAELSFVLFSNQTRGELNYQIYNRWGQLIKQDRYFVNSSLFSQKVDLSEFNSDIYTIIFNYGSSKMIKRMIKI